ncbi:MULTISPECIES: sensor histidine kinase KdpD [unclassified Cupriavidus]|uniref:sensor histidine kinase n=1 Tax=unclassified Cupriavidus TaxID=2640874 RepID=UPI001BFFE718|nr:MULTISPECIES: sensor histidine kinase KdpD [unclassified Cupriavidus]MCA3190661.1 sensor histidine kinase KdpD [Cupriavidus sp.]MCA3197366.1 sensor histidine kinase KdpD [Cupriavidus sp.]MCA3202643.1 sensor histidine kinase KdpD [Cupriavidus sp.]MCA3208118.1 sensor histidine kinase KdpD [Cupriavidus sp.]MCA3235534.1 sensor histidine kinase KdpD [Cupriavidus sp.]
MIDTHRPDPDALLQRMQAEGARAARGKLRVYFGASAGVGKTFAMLAAARALREQGVDVVIGVVETHGRAETESLVNGLERLPLRDVPYRDRVLHEFDLDGALARRPALVLVDELAHSNAAGSRHPKRWQDIQELQAAGIDVWTTVNVQHLESLNQAVGGITGVRVWETVPDAVFDGADEVVLVDLPADELLRRLREGKVYLPEQARHAARNFFRKGNLIALRELALRRTADRVDDDVRAYRHAEAIQPVWRTREAVLACIGTGDDAEQVVRSARRLASQLDCDWHVVTIATPRLMPLADPVRTRVRAAMQLAEELGARTETLAGHDMVKSVAGYVRRHNLTKVLVGRARADWHAEGSLPDRARMWLARALSPVVGAGNRLIGRQTFADALAAGCPEIDVIRVAADTTRADLRPRAPQVAEPRPEADAQAAAELARQRRRDYAFAVVWCAGATGLSMLASPWVDLVNIAMLFLAGVVGVALRHGRGPAALASVLAVAAFDFFFVPPRMSFAVSDVQYVLTFLVLLTVGLVIGQLTAGLREQAQVAVRRETDARTLYELARELSAALTTEQVVEIGSRFMRAAFDAHVTFFLMSEQGRLGPVASGAPGEKSDKGEAIDTVLAQWVFDHGQPAGTGTHTLPGSTVLYLPLKAPMQTRGVLAVEPRAWHALAEPELRRQADVFATLIAIGIERLHYVEVAQRALVSIESERLRSSLLAAVSHDLRTPLTGLIGMAETLQRATPPLIGDVAETVDAIRGQALRMRTMVVNLLDMARLQQPDLALQRGWQSLEELVGAALASMREALKAHRVQVADLSALPLVECDAVLMERVLCNLLENAAKYTAPGTVVRIRGELSDDEVRLVVEDEGPGVAPGQERHIFEKFTRGQQESATAGVGLGLAVCDAIMQAHGGRIWVEPAAPGARFTLALPRGNPPAIEPEPLDAILSDPH